ncbi:L-lysine 6-monooxygenase [Streptomyces venezuelae]|uniref:L-lysine N6-monooxygenase MbtG n=1 Tax=Streptomyces venezuelae TaxID=54571 RepID=A0A5P2AX66_STRVZ|nr:L-lysine 6-monooxygenase [Streptomyces venezuelae]
MSERHVELLAIGAGPANLALAVALSESAPSWLVESSLVVEQAEDVTWQRGMMMPWARSQVSFLKDLVTLRNPTSRFSFLNYLHSVGRLDDFINTGTFTPHRMEISAYLRWVAAEVPIPVEFNKKAVGIRPVRLDSGDLDGWQVTFSDGSVISCRNLVIGGGRDPYVPEAFRSLPAERVIHSTEFSERIGKLDKFGAHRIAVVGAAQSAGEMLWSSYQEFPHARLTLLMRSIGLVAYEGSKFTNELFYPSFVDEFHASRPEARRQMLDEMYRTNYGGLAPDLLNSLYHQMYQDRLTGTERIDMVSMSDVTSTRMDGDDVVLTYTDRRTGRTDSVRCDTVLLGTGFVRSMPRHVRDLADSLGLADVEVTRDYRLVVPGRTAAGCYLQGVNEATHGIADSLLSVLASRSGEIAADIVRHYENSRVPSHTA